LHFPPRLEILWHGKPNDHRIPLHKVTVHAAHPAAAIPGAEARDWTLTEAYRYCEAMTAAHYENFPVASFLIPAAKRRHISVIYAFARTADDFADEPGLGDGERLEALQQWRELLEECFAGNARHPVFLALGETAMSCGLPPELFHRLLRAFESDVTVHRFETREDVLAYCRNSAEPVGRLVLLLFGYRDDVLMKCSDKVCTALQLANFWQDLSIDLQKDRVYLPKEDLVRFGVSEGDLLQGRSSGAVRSLIGEMATWAQAILEEGKPLLGHVGWDLKLELRLTYNGGKAILNRVRDSGEGVLHRRPVLPRGEKFMLLIRSLMGL